MIATETDLFSRTWHDHDRGGELPCTNVHTLLAYLISESAAEARTSEESATGVPSATISVIGPRCDDGTSLQISYRLNRGEFSRLPGEDKKQFAERLRELMLPRVPSWRLLAVIGVPR